MSLLRFLVKLKLFQISLILCATIIFIYTGYLQVQQFSSHPAKIEIEIKPSKYLSLPSITVCVPLKFNIHFLATTFPDLYQNISDIIFDPSLSDHEKQVKIDHLIEVKENVAFRNLPLETIIKNTDPAATVSCSFMGNIVPQKDQRKWVLKITWKATKIVISIRTW